MTLTAMVQTLPIASRSRGWDSAAAIARMRVAAGGPSTDKMDWTAYGKGFLYADPANKTNFAGYKLPYGDIINGKLTAIPRAVFAVASVLRGARGGVDIPASEMARCRSTITKWYAAFREEFKDNNLVAPWEPTTAEVAQSITDSIFHATVSLSGEGRMLSSKNLHDIENVVHMLQELVQRARKYQGYYLELDDDGVALQSDDPLAGTSVNVDADGIYLEAGERLGVMLRKARMASRISTSQVADAAGVSLSTYSKVESGQTNPPEDLLRKMCDAIGLDHSKAMGAMEMDMAHPMPMY